MSEATSERTTTGTTQGMISRRLDESIGGTCLIVGAAVFCAVRLLHGDTPAGEPQAALDFVRERPVYPEVHVFAALAMLFTVTGLMTLSRSLTTPVAWFLGNSGLAAALVGWAVFTVESTSEGLALPVLAGMANGAPAGVREQLAQAARAVAEMTYGPSLLGMALMIGVPLLLFGVAIVLDRRGASWLGWIGAVIGGLTVLTAVAIYLHPDIVPGSLLYGVLGSVLAQLWLIGLGVALVLRGRRAGRPVA